jgi:hypothetical protein
MRDATQHLLDWLIVRPAQPRPDASLISSPEWDALVAHAVAHTAAPQLFRHLSDQTQAVPPQVLQCSFAAMMWQKQQTRYLRRDVSAVLQTLNSVGITPIVLKGAHLAAMIYPDECDRPMSDVDLLVRLGEIDISQKALQDIGYMPEHAKSVSDWSMRSRDIRLLKDDALLVELHWSLSDPRDGVAIDLDGLWHRSREFQVSGACARVLCPEDLLLHVCFHAGVSHQFDEKGLRPLLDIRAIIDRLGDSLDWNAIVSRACDWRTERCTYLMLELARRVMAAPIPQSVLAELKPAKVSTAVYAAAQAQLFEVPGPRTPIFPRSIALAWVNPRSMWHHLFAPQNLKQPSMPAQMRAYVADYLGFAWRCLWRDRQRLLVIIRRFRRHLVLSTWFAAERGGPRL